MKDYLALVAVFLVGLVLRILWWHFGPKVIESEGIYYARVGENLASGRGLVGIHELGLQLLNPPLYASLIAAGVKLGLGSETAGRAISLLFGAALPVVAYQFGRRWHSPTAGWCAAVIAAVHPVLIVASTAVLTESAYLTLLLSALYFIVELMVTQSRRSAIVAGAVLGIAYLLRPEAFILTFLLAAAVVLANRTRLRQAAIRTGLLLSVFAIFAIPYIAFLTQQTGQIRFEAKSWDAIRYSTRLESGLNIMEVYYQIDDNLVEHGNALLSDLEQIQSTHVSAPEYARFLVKEAVTNFPRFMRALADPQLGAPFLLVLAGLGLFAVPWSRTRLRIELPFLIAGGFTLLTCATLPFFHDRYFYPVLPALVIWAGVGMTRLVAWTRSTALSLEVWSLVSRVAVAAAFVVPVALICAAGAVGVRSSDDLSMSWTQLPLRDDVPVGQWLRTQRSPVRMADTEPTVAYYAGDVLMLLPWTDSATAMRYLELKQPTFLILRDSDRGRRPYLADWLQAMPSEHFELVNTFQGQSGATYVYRWRVEQ